MKNTKAFYILTSKRAEVEDKIEEYDILIKENREQAKKLKKGSIERQELMVKANDLANSLTYQKLKIELSTLNFCINTTFYL